MKTPKLLLILLILLLAKTSTYAQPESFYHEFSIYYNDSVTLFCNQNSFQISDSTYLSSGNYGPGFYGLAGRVIWDSVGNALDAKYLDADESFYLNGLARINSIRFLLYGEFDLYHDVTGNYIDMAAAMVCFNQNGDVLWQKAYGGYAPGYPDIEEPSYNYSDAFDHVEIDTLNQRIYAMGYSESFNEEHKSLPYVVCTDYNGETLWTWDMPDLPEYDGGGFLFESIITSNDEILVVGKIRISETSTEDVNPTRGIIIKLSPDGEMLWHKTWGYNNASTADVIEISPGRYVMGGIHRTTGGTGISSGHLVKFDDEGNFLTEKEITRGDNSVIRLYKIFKEDNSISVMGMFTIKENGEPTIGNYYIDEFNYNIELINSENYVDEDYQYGAFGIGGISKTYDGGYLYTGYAGNQKNAVMKSDSELNLPLNEGWDHIDVNYTDTRISYYPNPVNRILSIKSSSEMLIKDLKLCDMYGRIVLQKHANQSTLQVDVSDIESGIYILRINNAYSGKIIIK
ncbi:MAG: T9SS type A sorting domain-containing protein [Bacteroidota bacterium]